MTSLARRNGWFAPVSELLDYLLEHHGGHTVLEPVQRQQLEQRWLFDKLRYGTA